MKQTHNKDRRRPRVSAVNERLDANLRRLRDEIPNRCQFTTSAVMSACQWGYRTSVMTIERGLDLGVIRMSDPQGDRWYYVFADCPKHQ